MGKTSADQELTTEWAIAGVGGGGMIISVALFNLVNRVTGRGHAVTIPTVGITYGAMNALKTSNLLARLVAPSASASLPSYTLFRTRKPVSFENFDGAAVRITSANIGLGYGYSWAALTIWDHASPAYFSKEIAYVKLTGWGAMLPGGSAGVHGVMIVSYGSGEPMGLVPRVLKIEIPDPPNVRIIKARFKPHEEPKFVLPADTLFDFDSARIRPEARTDLKAAAQIIVHRKRRNVMIMGHTDSVGRASYNLRLSFRRAQAVKTWMMKNAIPKAETFSVDGRGETQPIAPNKLPNGKDNPEGRQKNRRVEIYFFD